MSQHSDIFTHEIVHGISNGLKPMEIAHKISNLLDVLQYDESFTDLKAVTGHLYSHLKWMRTQKDGLYGMSHSVIETYIDDLWLANQWLPAA